MNPQQLQREINQAVTGTSGNVRRMVAVNDAIRRIENYLRRRRLSYRYGIIVRGRRIFIADNRTQILLNEIGLDLHRGEASGKTFVYNVIIMGGTENTTPQPLEKGAQSYGTSSRSYPRQERRGHDQTIRPRHQDRVYQAR